ncbi:MAG TPA: PAS domain S-box protein, partial [Paenisporosarcina sp.]|nr:PAS domain S-box protein [Paenisporosarcina sp.]
MKNIKSMVPTNYELFLKKDYKVILVMNLEGYIIQATEAATDLLGNTQEELIKLKSNMIVTSEEFESFYYYFHKAVQGETHEFELGVQCNQGNQIELQVILVPNEILGQIVNISVYTKEISKPRKFELKLNQKELCESFIESNRDPILLSDLD